MKDNFTSSMTHEFKTPLSTLYAATEALDKYGVLDDKQMAKEYIELMQGELKRLNLMTESILNNAKLEAGKLEIKPENTQVYKMVDDALKKLNLRLQNAEAVVHTNSIAKDLYANLDQEHFTNVICNLIDNSLKYSNEPAIMSINAHKKDDMLEITYSDNGIGIPYKYRDDVFKPYFRIMENNIYTAQVHGLGLSYIKEVITLHKGTIKLIKSDNNKGTTFQILLPIANE
jgi:two-component system phosphate regulon sensor histidine kinase PhoR